MNNPVFTSVHRGSLRYAVVEIAYDHQRQDFSLLLCDPAGVMRTGWAVDYRACSPACAVCNSKAA